MLSLDFQCKENDCSRSYPYTQDILRSTNLDPDFMNTIITGDKSWVYVYDPEIVIFLAMKKSHSNAACHQLTLLIGETKFMYANKGCLRQVRFIEIHQDFVKKILNSGTFRTGSYLSTDQWE